MTTNTLKGIFLTFLMFFLPVSSVFAGGGDTDQTTLTQFYSDLQTEINIAEKKVQTMWNNLQNQTTIFPSVMIVEMEQAIAMLNVKKTLFLNFKDTPSVHIPAIRAKLLTIFKMDIISEVELLELQNLVSQYKES